jgi:Ca-activated chloride channel family protein
MSDSIWDDPNVTAYILGELPPEEAEVFEKRIQQDSSLAEAVAEARSVTDQLQVMYNDEANATLAPNRREAITAGGPKSTRAPDQPSNWRLPLILLATAAALLLLIGSPMLMQLDVTVSNESTNSILSSSEDAEAYSTLGNAESEFMAEGQADNSAEPSSIQRERKHQTSGALKPRDMTLQEKGDLLAFDKKMMAKESKTEDMAQSFGAGMEGMQDLQEELSGESPDQELPPMSIAAPSSARAKTSNTQSPFNRRQAKTALESERFPIPDLQRDDDAIASRDQFQNVTENAFKRVADAPLSTFSVDVDTASYSKVREYLLRQRRLPPVDAVRIEEMVNYFNYEYLPPKDDAEHPFAAKAEIISCPWNDDHRIARIALKGKTMQPKNRPLSNLVFLLDTSGSMNSANKLPLVKAGLNMLLSQLGENDRVAIVVYAGSAGLVLDSTPATKTREIENALNTLAAGGSTNGGQGIQLAYQTARDNYIDGGVNRVILCTDGDFNVGTTGTGSLVRMVEKEAAGNIFLSVLGFGMGNHNDSMLEQISGRGNGNYAFIDTQKEAQKVLVDQASGTLVTIAKDVKLQIEFNPRMVSAYRLIGYENRMLAKEDFNDDKKDAGEIGAGHTVTALYELIPAGSDDNTVPPKVDDLKYQGPSKLTDAANRDESLTLKLRYKEPDGDTSKLVEFPVVDNETTFQDADHDARFAAAVASFGMQLRKSKYAGDWNLKDVIDVAKDAKGEDMSGLRAEFVEMVKAARKMQE